MRSFVKYWLPVVLWLGVIFIGSSDLMSAEHTSRFLVPFLLWLKPDISVETVALIQFGARKAAHLLEYAILAILLGRAVFRGTNLKMKMPLLYASVWLVCTLVAAGDEFHQSFVPARGAAWGDALIDSAGGIFGLAIYLGFGKRRMKKE